MKAYSQDLRERVIRQWETGKSQPELANLFAVSIGSVKRWICQYQRTGSVAPKVRQHWTGTIGPEQHAALCAQVAQLTDATLEQYIAVWAQTQGVHVSSSTMWRALQAIDWPLKKRSARPNGMRPHAPPFVSCSPPWTCATWWSSMKAERTSV